MTFVDSSERRGVEGHAMREKAAWANGMDQGLPSISTERNSLKPGAGPKPTRRIAEPVLKPGRRSLESTKKALDSGCTIHSESHSMGTAKPADRRKSLKGKG